MATDAPIDPPRSRHERFRFRSAESLLHKAAALGVALPFDDRPDVLFTPIATGGRIVANRIVVQPMEGRDATSDGAPSELTVRRYRRYAAGGSGLIWFEATSAAESGRASEHQLWISRGSVSAFARLVDDTRRAVDPSDGQPVLILQVTHSGRSTLGTATSPRRIACRNPHLDRPAETAAIWRDEDLDAVGRSLVEAAVLARDAGFDGVDVKACHGYLLHELLGSFTREHSRYGGPSLENRARLLLEVIARIRDRVPDLLIAVRLNATDLVPYPYGFGTAPDGSSRIDLTETIELTRRLTSLGVSLLNVTAGIPVHAAHIGRPFDRAAGGGPVPAEHPLEGVARLIEAASVVQAACPAVPVVASGFSWLRQHWPGVAAAVVREGRASLVGLGRGAFAYPDAPRDLRADGRLRPGRCCTACSSCTERMRRHEPTGCVIRDPAYRPVAPKQG